MPFFTTTKSKTTSTPRSATPTHTTKNTTIPSATPTTTMVTDTKLIAPTEFTKDAREFEHGRQKAKKSARTQMWREEKARARLVKSVSYVAPQPQPLAKGKRTRGAVPAVSDRPDWEDETSAMDAQDEWIRYCVEEEELEGSRIVRSESGRLEVDLTNLLKPAKPRKSKRADSDFEVLPGVRQVVALDDRFDDGELELDEPWEHLSVDGVDDEKGISYAEVAAIAC